MGPAERVAKNIGGSFDSILANALENETEEMYAPTFASRSAQAAADLKEFEELEAAILLEDSHPNYESILFPNASTAEDDDNTADYTFENELPSSSKSINNPEATLPPFERQNTKGELSIDELDNSSLDTKTCNNENTTPEDAWMQDVLEVDESDTWQTTPPELLLPEVPEPELLPPKLQEYAANTTTSSSHTKEAGAGAVLLSPRSAPKSELVSKLFTKPKPRGVVVPAKTTFGKTSNNRSSLLNRRPVIKKTRNPPPPTPSVSEEVPSSNTLPAAVEQKLVELQKEIESYKTETKKLKSKNLALEKEKTNFEKEKSDFKIFVADQKTYLSKEREDNSAKLKTERRLMERQVKNRLALPDRRERVEIEELKTIVASLKAEMASKASKANATIDRLKSKISLLEQRNEEHVEALRSVEARRIEKLETELCKPYDDLNNTTRPFFPEDEYDPNNYQETETEKCIEVVHHGNDKVEKRFANGRRLIVFRNKTEKQVFPDGRTTVRFVNGDVKKTFKDKTVYYYAEAQTTHTTFTSTGTQVFEFPNSQIETHFADLSKEIQYADGTQKRISPSGESRSFFPDGSTVIEKPDGFRETFHLDGTRRRDYPDGRSTFVEGTQETTLS